MPSGRWPGGVPFDRPDLSTKGYLPLPMFAANPLPDLEKPAAMALPAWTAACSAPLGAARRPMAATAAATILFLAGAALLSAVTGAPFTIPTENMSRAIGVHYIVPFALGMLGYGVVQAVQIAFRRGDRTRAALWRNVRIDLFFMLVFVAVIYGHFHVKMWMPLANPRLYDAAYYALDQDLRGLLDGVDALRAWLAPFIPSADNWYQVGFFLMFALTLWCHSVGERRFHLHNLVAILLLEMVGAFTYLAFPAVGPFIYEAGLNPTATHAQASMYAMFQQVQQQGAAWLAQNGGDYFTGPPAAMPSLHIAGALIMTTYAIRARSVVAPLMLALTFWILIESMASRWHYFADLPFGLLLALAAMAAANRICHRTAGADQRSRLTVRANAARSGQA